MDRKELLLEAEKTEKKVNTSKLNAQIDEGMALASMKESRGWRIVYEGYIKKRLSEDRFYDATPETLAEVRAAMKELKELMKFIDGRIDTAKESAKIQ